MTTAGLYETSGDWLYDVGLPGKSGIGGGIVTVSPGKGGLGTFAPPLDAAGNSVKGQLVARDPLPEPRPGPLRLGAARRAGRIGFAPTPTDKDISVNLHTDLPTRTQIDRLLESRHTASVSIYLSTSPISNGDAERIELKNLAAEGRRQLELAGLDRAGLAAIDEAIADLAEDDTFWRYQARSLAIFATPESLTTFRLPNQLVNLVEVSDRFHVKPLLRALTFPHVDSSSRSPRAPCACSRWWRASRPPRFTCPSFPAMSRARPASPRSRIEHQAAGSRARRARRFACGNTHGRSIRRSGRC